MGLSFFSLIFSNIHRDISFVVPSACKTCHLSRLFIQKKISVLKWCFLQVSLTSYRNKLHLIVTASHFQAPVLLVPQSVKKEVQTWSGCIIFNSRQPRHNHLTINEIIISVRKKSALIMLPGDKN